MIYNCKILDPDGKTHEVSVTLRGLQHEECVIVGNLSIEAYHQGIDYKKLLSYTKELESGETVTCVKPTSPPVKVLKPTAEGIMADWLRS